MDSSAAALGTAATSATTSPDHIRNPSTSAQLRPSLVIDAAACDSSNGDLPTSTKLGPLTCSAFGPRTSSGSYCAVGNGFSTADAGQELYPFCLKASQQQLQQQHQLQAGSRSSGVVSDLPHNSRASRQPKVVFGGTASTHSPRGSSRPGAAASPHALSGSSTPRTKARLSTAAAAGLASPSGSSKSPGSSTSGSDGAGRASVAAGANSSTATRQARASAIEASKHYGSWFLPTQDWNQVSRLNPGSTWSRESMHWERIEQQHAVAQQLGLLDTVIDEDTDAGDLWPVSSPGGTAAMAAAHAATATEAAPGSKSDPGLSSRGLGSPAYGRSVAPSLFARSALGFPASAPPSADGPGAGAGSSAAVDSFLQCWDSHQSGQRSSCVAARGSIPGVGQLQGTTAVTQGLERGLSDNIDTQSFWSCSSPGPSSRLSSCAGAPHAAAAASDRLPSSSTGGGRCSWGAGSAQQVTDPEQPPCSGHSSPLGRRTSSTAGCLMPNMPRPSQGMHAAANSPAGPQSWLGHEPATEEAEQEGAAAALADQQYYEQLLALAAQQAQLHGQLRDTFALKAYKDYMHTKGFRQPGSLRRLPTPTEHDIEVRQKQQLLQQVQQQQLQLQRQMLSRQRRQQQQQQKSASRSQQQQQQAEQQVNQQQQQQASLGASSTVNASAEGAGAAADVAASKPPSPDAAAGSSSSSSNRQPSHSTCSSPRMSLVSPSSRLRASSTSPRHHLRLSAASPRCSQAVPPRLSAVAKPDEQQQQQQQQWGPQAVPRLQMTEVQQQQLQDLRQLKGSCHPHSGLGSEDWQLLKALLTGGRQAAAAAAVGASASRAATSAGAVSGHYSSAGGSQSARECSSRQQASRSLCNGATGISSIDSSRAHSSIGSSRGMSHSSRGAGSLASSCRDHGVLSSSTGGSSMSGSSTGGSSMSGSTSTGLGSVVQAACSSIAGQLQPAAGSGLCQTAAAATGPAAGSMPAAQSSKAPSGSCGGLLDTTVSMGQQQQQQQPMPALQAQIGILQQEGSFDWDSMDLVEPTTPMTPAALLVRAALVPGTAPAAGSAAGTAAALCVGWGLDAELAASILDPEAAAELQQLVADHPMLQTSSVLGSVCGTACSAVGASCTYSTTGRTYSPQQSRPGTNRSSVRQPWTAATSLSGSLGRCSPIPRPLVPTLDPSLLKPVPCDISYTLTSRRESKPGKAAAMLGKAEHRSCSSPRGGKSSSGCNLSHAT